MGALMIVGACCMVISAWAVLQLSLMGLFYTLEATTLLEDVEAHDYTDYKDFIAKTERNYASTGRNCFIVAGIYVVMLILSIFAIRTAKAKAKKIAADQEDDELICLSEMPTTLTTGQLPT